MILVPTAHCNPRPICGKALVGFYGADTICVRPKGHSGECYQVHQCKDWDCDLTRDDLETLHKLAACVVEGNTEKALDISQKVLGLTGKDNG